MSDNDERSGTAAGVPANDPDPRGLDLHRRLVERDPLAQRQLMEMYYLRLVAFAARQIHDQAMRDDIASDLTLDVISKLIDDPGRFDPARGKSLYGFLVMDLRGDLINHFARLRRGPKIVSLDAPVGSDDDDVGQHDLGGNLSSGEPGPEALAMIVESDGETAVIRRRVAMTDDERIVFDLQYGEGERGTDVFAQALGIADLPAGEQVERIQRIKDRLAKRLRRMREGPPDERGRGGRRDSTGR